MCGQGVCAHGSRTVIATDSAVPHDSAVLTNTRCARVCNTHHPRGHTRTPAEPARNGEARPIRSPLPRITPPGTTTPETLTPVSDVMTHHNLAPVVPPISSRNRTDLDTGYDRSRHARRGAVRRGRRTALAGLRISPRRASAPAPARTGVRSRCRSRPRASRRRWRSSWRRPTACS